MRPRRISAGRRGSSLVLVLIVFTVFLLLGGAVLTLGAVSTYRTRAQVDEQQAYFTAKSAVSATVRYIQSNSDLQQKIAAMTTVNDSLGGSYGFSSQAVSAPAVQITVAKVANGLPILLRVTASATQNGITSKATAYVTGKATQTTSGLTVYPFDNILYDNSSATGSNYVYGKLYGNLAIAGDCLFSGGSELHGTLFTSGKVTATSGVTLQNICSAGTVDLESGPNVTGNIYTLGDFIENNATVAQNVYAAGNGSINHTIGGMAAFFKNVTLNWTPSIHTLIYGGTLTCPQNFTLSSYVSNPPSGPTAPAQNPANPALVAAKVNFVGPTFSQSPVLPTDKVGNNSYTLSHADFGTSLSKSCFLTQNGTLGWGGTIYLDTTGGDLYLILNANMTIPYNVNFYVRGKHRVFFYLSGSGTTFTINGQLRVDPADPTGTSDPPRVYIIGTWPGAANGQNGQTVSMSGSCVDAYIYLPNGKVTASSANNSYSYSFRGSICAGSAYVSDNGIIMNYVAPPDLSDTALSGLSSDGSQSNSGGSVAWALDGWADP